MARRGGLDRRAAEIAAWHVEGKSDAEIAELVSTKRRTYTRQAITQVRKRHAQTITALEGKVAEAVEDVTIANKAERIRRLGKLYDVAEAEFLERGVFAKERKMIGSGFDQYEVEVVRFDAQALMALRALSHEVADQLGEIPKPGINVDARTQVITLEAVAKLLEAGEL